MNRMRLGATLRRVVGVAILSLVLAQWVALVHAIEHAHGPSAAVSNVRRTRNSLGQPME